MGKECAYHLCKKRSEQLHRCRYCSKYYCDEHLQATLPSRPFGPDHRTWEQKGHPCPDYVERYKEEKKAEEEKIQKATIKLIRGPSIKVEKPYIWPPANKCTYCHDTFAFVLNKCWYCHNFYCNRHIKTENHDCQKKKPKPEIIREPWAPQERENGRMKKLFAASIAVAILFFISFFLLQRSQEIMQLVNPVTTTPFPTIETKEVQTTSVIPSPEIEKIEYLSIGELNTKARLAKIRVKIDDKFKEILNNFDVDDTKYRDFTSDYGGYLVQEYIYELYLNKSEYNIKLRMPAYFSWLLMKYPDEREFTAALKIDRIDNKPVFKNLHSDVGFERKMAGESGGLYCGDKLLVLFHYDDVVKSNLSNSAVPSPLDYILNELFSSCEKWLRESSGCTDKDCGDIIGPQIYIEEGDYRPSININYQSSMGIIDYLNSIRVENGRTPIKFDQRVLDLAIARSRDMFERNYFDHVSPTGECAETMKKSFGFNDNDFLAENVWGTFYNDGRAVNSEVSMKDAIDSWLASRGHRYNLFYEKHEAGAVGCYKGICTFLGLQHDPYGLGAGGKCYSAAEGTAYWNSAPTQQDELVPING